MPAATKPLRYLIPSARDCSVAVIRLQAAEYEATGHAHREGQSLLTVENVGDVGEAHRIILDVAPDARQLDA